MDEADYEADSMIEEARRVAEEVLFPNAMAVESTGVIPASHLDLLAAQGFYGMAGPREAGGLGLRRAVGWQVLEIMAGGCLSTAFVLLQHHGAVRAIAENADAGLRDRWLRPLRQGERRAGLALAGAMPGPPMLRARTVSGGYVFDGISPWVTGWGLIDTLYAAARDQDDNVVWAVLDIDVQGALSAEPLQMVAVMASQTGAARLR